MVQDPSDIGECDQVNKSFCEVENMKFVRKIVGALILFFDRVFTPKSISRDIEAQRQVDQATTRLKLYEYHACPFCVKVRRSIKRLNLNVELRDSKVGSPFRDELMQHGGKTRVPCLRIEGPDGKQQWMYESSDIVAYLEGRFRAFPAAA